LLVHGHLTDEDIVQISTSARATLGNTCFMGACTRIGALWYLAGLVEPVQSLALLSEKHTIAGKKARTSVLNVYPSYLGQLVEEGQRQGYGPSDFGLERIMSGGEIVTAGLKRRAQTLFGPVEFIEGYAMTEQAQCGASSNGTKHILPGPSEEDGDVAKGSAGIPGSRRLSDRRRAERRPPLT
jgi:phenylacetate-coenzyme A ligase PaaK-like adenylate-forming protein